MPNDVVDPVKSEADKLLDRITMETNASIRNRT